MSTAAGPVLEVRDLTVEIDVPAGTLHAVTGVDFEVGRGETLSLVGESGCGKTMTALAVMGLLPGRARVSARRIALEGTDLRSHDARRLAELRGNRLAMIFQDPMTSLNPVYTIGDQLAEVYVRHGKGDRKAALARARALLARVGITAPEMRLGQYPHELSGGLRQRMMIAMALMCEPVLIIADEPTTALDVTVQAQILALLKSLQEEFDVAMILITHDLGVVSRVANRVAVMYAGRVVEHGTAAEVFEAPTHPYTRGLMACIPEASGAKAGARLGSIPGIVPSLIGSIDGCMFRNRCELAHQACATGEVALRPLGPSHGYRCVLEPAAARGAPAASAAVAR